MSGVVNVKVSHIRPEFQDLSQWCLHPDHVYIARKGVVFINGERYPKQDSIWANPFKIGRDGTREEILQKYRQYIQSNPLLLALLPELQGKILGCWCKPAACHGDILMELVDLL
jgi:hypothetical protein